MVDEKLMTTVRYLSEAQRENFKEKIVNKTTAQFVFVDAVEAYIETGETAGRLMIQRNEANDSNEYLSSLAQNRLFELETARQKIAKLYKMIGCDNCRYAVACRVDSGAPCCDDYEEKDDNEPESFTCIVPEDKPKLESCAGCNQENDAICPGDEGECAFVPGGVR